MKRVLIPVLLAASPALAETLTVFASASGYPGDGTIWGTPTELIAELPQFDPALGSLDMVEFRVQASHKGTFAFQNIAGAGKRVRVEYVDWFFEVNAFGGTGGNLLLDPWVTPPDANNPWGAPPGHWNLPLTGVIPVGGSIGPLPFGTELFFQSSYVAADTEFGAFQGNGTLPVQMLDAAVFSVTVFGTGQNAWQLNSMCDINVEATYHYTVPEPASVALVAVAGLLALRRR